MKKRIISLLLIAALCLGLCACGKEVPQEQLDLLCGMWYSPENMGIADTGMPGYLEFTADGQCTYNGEGGYTWTAKPDKNDENMFVVTIKSESKEKHTFTVWTGDPNYIDGQMSWGKEGPYLGYVKVNTVSETSWAGDAMIEWTARGDDENVYESVVLNADGTCTLDGEKYFWTTQSYSDRPEEYMHLEFFNTSGVGGMIDFNKQSNDLLSMDMQIRSGDNYNWGGGYVCHPMLNLLNDGNWRSFERYTCIDDYLYFGIWSETSSIGETEYDLEFDVSAADTLTVNFQEGGNTRYSAKVFMDGEYLMTTLTDVESGNETLYYNDAFGYAEDHPDAAYYKTINQVYEYANDYGLWDQETDEYIDREDALPYLYEKLQALGDYKQTQEFLDRFTIVPSMLVKTVQYTTDQLNNVSESWLGQYQYDQNGVMTAARGEENIQRYGMNEDYDWLYFTYDANGRVTMIEDKSGDTVYAVGTPTYDAAGNLVTMDVATTSGRYTTTFTYDDQGRRILMAMPQDYYDEPMTWAYTYDDQGNVSTVVKTWSDGYYSDTTTYAYANGAVVSKNVTRAYRGTDDYTTTYQYTNDAQGRHLSAVVTTNDDVSYRSREVQYTYEDLYFFDNTGLVFEEE